MPSKQEQIEDAQNRLEVPPQPVSEGAPQTPLEQATQVEDQPRSPPQPREDNRRNDIVARFRQRREQTEQSDIDDIRAFAHQGLPPEMVERQEEQPLDPEIEQPAAPPVAKHKIKVLGEEKELTIEELTALAQKNAAGDAYLEEARSLKQDLALKSRELDDRMRRVDELLNSGQRSTQPAQNQTGQNGAQSGEEPAVENQDSPYTKLAKDIVYGEPEEAGRNIQTTVETAATTAARQELERQRQQDEITRSKKFVREFQADHADIDENAEAVITKRIYDLQSEDLEKLAPTIGLRPDQLPTRREDIANWHLFYRTQGKVRSVEEMTKTAYDDFVKWRGPRTAEPPKTETPATSTQPQVPPKVVIAVNREERRMQIPQQPTRTSVPAQVQPTAQQPASRSQIVANMAALRARPRGKVGLA